MSAFVLKATEIADIVGSDGRAEHFCSARLRSNVNLLSNGEGIVHIDAEILNSALYFGVT